MLPARKLQLPGRLLTAYIHLALRRHFERILLFGGTDAPAREEAYPLIWYSTHQTWWDGFLEIPLVRRFNQDLWLMMDEANLRKFPAFRWVGVFGVDLSSAQGRAAALLYAAKRLRGGGRASLYLYPHGRLVRPHEPWPACQGGVAELLRLVPAARAVPVAKELFHGAFRDPFACIELGEPIRGDTPDLERALLATRDRLRARIAADALKDGIELLGPKWWGRGRT
jgi:1-acyl-sn-glycerol-3-phosphate acyltransferase